MENISGTRGLLDALDEQVNQILTVEHGLADRLRNAGETALALAERNDTSLARLTIASLFAGHRDRVRELEKELREQWTTTVSAIREALDS